MQLDIEKMTCIAASLHTYVSNVTVDIIIIQVIYVNILQCLTIPFIRDVRQSTVLVLLRMTFIDVLFRLLAKNI